MQHFAFGLGIAVTLLVGCSGGDSPVAQLAHVGVETGDEIMATSVTPTVEYVARNYRSLRLVTKEPVLVDPQLALLCVGIHRRHIDNAAKRTGPHAHTAILIFMNDLAAGAFHESAAMYPVGSAIVKEKQGLEYIVNDSSPQASARTHDGVGGMIKRAAGYDPAHGDWEYFYFEDETKIERGRISSCVECHAGAAASDHVFGDWATRR